MIYLYSDPHFGHKNVIEYCNRPFSSVEEMNEALIANFNSVVQPEDTTYFLGDTFFCSQEQAKAIMSRLNGTKILIRGNHDLSVNIMYRIGFSFVCENAQIKVGQTYVNLSHYPYKYKPWNHLWLRLTSKKYRHKLNWKKLEDEGGWLCHGHTHSKEKIRGKMIHAGVDAWDYKPFPITKVSEFINIYEEQNKREKK